MYALVVSRAIGAADYPRVRRLTVDSLLLGIIIVAVFVSVGLQTISPLFSLLGAEGGILEYIDEYMRVWYVGMVFVVVPMVGNNIIRATGDSKTPGIVMIVGASANVILDPILIFGLGPVPALGIRGAAMATLIGRGFTFFVTMYVLIVREKLLTFARHSLSDVLESWREILNIGVPNAGARMIIPLGQGVITRVIATFGPAAVAGYGVATRIEFFSLAALNALSSVIPAFIGQNLGAGHLDRVDAGFRVSRRFALYVGGVLFLVYLVLAPRIATVFNGDPEVVRTAARYMRIVSAAYAAQGLYLVISAGLNVLKRPLTAAGLGVMEMFVLAIPLVLLGAHLARITGIVIAIAVSYLVTGVVAWIVVMRVVRIATRSPSS